MNTDELIPNNYYWAKRKHGDSKPEIVFYYTDGIGDVDVMGSDELFRLHEFEFLKMVEPYEI